MKIRNFLPLCLAAVSPLSLSASPGDTRWSFATGDVVFGSPALDAAGNIFFGSQDNVFYSLTAGGQPRWQFSGATDWIDSSPSLSADGSTVYFGSWDNFLYAVDATSGTQKWRFETGSYIIASPALGDDGTVYVGSGDGIFYAVSATGQLLWAYPADGEIESSAVVDAHNRITFASTAGTIYSLNADGSLRWTFDASTVASDPVDGHGVYASLSLDADGRIYIGSRNQHLIVLHPDGTFAWSFAAAEMVDSAPVITAEGTVYFAARDGYLYALDADGFFEWELLIGDVFYASPVLDANGSLYTASYADSGQTLVQAIGPDGGVQWARSFAGYNDASLTIGTDGSILFGSYDGSLYALEASGTLPSTGWPKFGRDARQSRAAKTTVAQVDSRIRAAFGQIIQAHGDWYEVNWIANGWFFGGYFPWINHLEHGWWWCGHAQPDSFWVFDLQLGWIYAGPAFPDYFFSVDRSAWLLHTPGTSYHSTGRWFYDFSLVDPGDPDAAWFWVPASTAQ